MEPAPNADTSRPRPRSRPMTRAGGIAVLVIALVIAGATFLVVNRLVRQGEPSFIGDIKPEHAVRVTTVHCCSGLISGPKTFASFYGTDESFAETRTHYSAELQARGFTLRVRPAPGESDEFDKYSGPSIVECVTLEIFRGSPQLPDDLARIRDYPFGYVVTYSRHC